MIEVSLYKRSSTMNLIVIENSLSFLYGILRIILS